MMFRELRHKTIEPLPLTGGAEAVYYFHSDHLGSASWITNNTGLPVQHLQYLPFGVPFVNEQIATYSERFTFTGKERDAETGYYYHGARFNCSDIGWLSVDPLFEKYPTISPYTYCANNPVKYVDPEGRDFDPEMEKYASQIEKYCGKQITKLTELSKKESLTDEQKEQLREFESAQKEIQEMRDDRSTYYSLQKKSLDDKDTKGITKYSGYRELDRKGKQQYWINVSLNIDCGLFDEEEKLTRRGGYVLAHELKHCYQFYNKETLYIQLADGSGIKDYNTKALEEAAYRRGAAFGCYYKFEQADYPDLFSGTMDDFINKYPGTVIKHK